MATTEIKDIRDIKDLTRVYNHAKNLNGGICHVILASQRFNEAVDLAAVRHIHIYEPLLTQGMMSQAVGRARRFCSHYQYDNMDNWTVKVHQYLGEKPVNMVINNTKKIANTLETVKQNLDRIAKEREGIKGIRGTNASKKRKNLDDMKKELMQRKKNLVARQRESGKVNVSNVEMVDKMIFEQAAKKGLEMERIFNALRSGSLDCVVLHDYHTKQMGMDYSCANY